MSACAHPCKTSSGDESDVSLHSSVSKKLKKAQENVDQKTEDEEKLESSIENVDEKIEEGEKLESSVENVDEKTEDGEKLESSIENVDPKTEEGEKLESSVENVDEKTEDGEKLESSVENVDEKIEEGEKLENSAENVVQKTEEGEKLENSAENVDQKTQKEDKLESSVENVVQKTEEGEESKSSLKNEIEIERLKRVLENINSRRLQFVNIRYGNTKKLREIVDFVTVIKQLNHFESYLNLTEACTIIRSFVDCGFFHKTVDEDTKWYDADKVMICLKQCKINNGTLYYDLMQLPLYKARHQYGLWDFWLTNRAITWFRRTFDKIDEITEDGEKFEARLGGILLRSILQKWAARSLRELTHCRLPDICYDMIVDTDLSNKDLRNICLAASKP